MVEVAVFSAGEKGDEFGLGEDEGAGLAFGWGSLSSWKLVSPSRHRRRMPLIRLLARLGWQRDPQLWTMPCRDGHGRRARLLIRLWPSRITLTATADGPLYLTAQDTGWLWGASRDVLNTCGLLTRTDPADPAPRAAVTPALFEQPPAQREVVQIERFPRPTGWELWARQAPGT